MDDCTEIPSQVLLIEGVLGSQDALARRILALGINPLQVAGPEQAKNALGEHYTQATAILVCTDLPIKNLKRQLRKLRKAGPASGLLFVSMGKAPPSQERKKLRAAGLKLALWEPYDDATLRYQLNRAVNGDRDDHKRADPRAPTDLAVRILVADRAKQAMLYSLSAGGAFLQTTRASMNGAQIEIELQLPEGPVSTRGEVIFSNVPGNLQRPNLPLGMGVRFDDLDNPTRNKIQSYVKQRLSQLEV